MRKLQKVTAFILFVLMSISIFTPYSVFAADNSRDYIDGALDIIDGAEDDLYSLDSDLSVDNEIDLDIKDTLEDINNFKEEEKIEKKKDVKNVKKITASISNASFPDVIIKEEASKFVASGVVKAKEKKIKRVSFNILSSKGSIIYHKTKGGMNVSSFNMKELSCSKDEMSGLDSGDYKYKIYVTGVGESSATVVFNVKFKVMRKYPKMDTDITTPYSLCQGQDFKVSGEFSSDFSMKKIEIGIVNSITDSFLDGHKYELIRNENEEPLNEFSINDNVNSALNFDTLVSGSYYYRCYVENERGGYKLFNIAFNVKSPVNKNVGRFNLSGANRIDTFTYDKAIVRKFYPIGTIKSSEKNIDSVRIYVANTRNMVRKEITKKNIGSDTFDLSKLSSIDVNAFAGDKYTYNVEAKGVGDSEFTKLYSSSFTITKPFKVTKSSVGYPSSLIRGCSFSLKGTIKGSYKMTKVQIGIVKNSKWYGKYNITKNINSTSFNIATVDYAIKFGTLPLGTYNYKAVIWYNDKEYTVFNYSFKVKALNNYWYKLYFNYKKPKSIKASSTSLRNKYVAKAKTYVGKKETDKKWQKTIGYNTARYAWCDVFVHFVAKKTNAKVAKSITYPYNCGNIIKKAMKKKKFVPSRCYDGVVPKKGDLILWDKNYNYMPDHISIVTGVSKDKSKIYTIGGNEGDKVSQNAYTPSPGDTRIIGFIRW